MPVSLISGSSPMWHPADTRIYDCYLIPQRIHLPRLVSQGLPGLTVPQPHPLHRSYWGDLYHTPPSSQGLPGVPAPIPAQLCTGRGYRIHQLKSRLASLELQGLPAEVLGRTLPGLKMATGVTHFGPCPSGRVIGVHHGATRATSCILPTLSAAALCRMTADWYSHNASVTSHNYLMTKVCPVILFLETNVLLHNVVTSTIQTL